MTMSPHLTRTEALATLRDQVATHVALPGEPGDERCTPWNVAAAWVADLRNIQAARGVGHRRHTDLGGLPCQLAGVGGPRG